MQLVIAEKPSVAQSIAVALGVKEKKDGYIEGGGYLISWCVGHLVQLAEAAAYGEQYRKWSYDSLPILPQNWQYTVAADKGKQFKILKELMHRADVSEVVNACDAGREGELIFRFVYEVAGCKKPMRRLWISSMEDAAIRSGFDNLKDGLDYDALFASALCRAKADWIIGINATRLFSCLYNCTLNVGRVQTPTLKMLADRDAAISTFKKEKYYHVRLTLSGTEAVSEKLSDAAAADELKAACETAQAECISVTREKKTVSPPKLFDLTSLQREANRIYGYTAKQTLDLAQALYEKRLLTYPRTDSRYITTDVADTLKERLKACSVGPYRKLAGSLSMRPIRKNASFVDNKKVTDHHAIIPTEQFVDLQTMTNEERKVYDLVVRRFLAVLLPAFEYDQTVFTGGLAGESFTAKGKIVKSQGWKEAYENLETDEEWEEADDLAAAPKEQTLPSVKKGDSMPVAKVTVTTGKTTPPAYFTEATLLSAMENPVRYMESKDAKAAKTLGETGGLGTVATRADIIDKLFNSFLMEKKGNEIHVTGKGKQLLELVPSELKKPELTAAWEMKLSGIAKGNLQEKAFIEEISDYTEELIREIKAGTQTFRHDNLTNKKCPQCGKRLLAVNGKNSKMLVCQDRECGYRETLSRTSNARCPKCHKKMELYGKGEDQTFICKCGYKEKLSAFKNRREKEGAGVSKRDVQSYLKKQQKEAAEPLNNAFAAAFAKLDIK